MRGPINFVSVGVALVVSDDVVFAVRSKSVFQTSLSETPFKTGPGQFLHSQFLQKLATSVIHWLS